MLLAVRNREQHPILARVKLPSSILLCYCPVPVNAAVWGLTGALSATCSAAENLFRLVGEKVTLIVQLAPIARLAPQLLVWEN